MIDFLCTPVYFTNVLKDSLRWIQGILPFTQKMFQKCCSRYLGIEQQHSLLKWL